MTYKTQKRLLSLCTAVAVVLLAFHRDVAYAALPATASLPQSGSIVSRWYLGEASGTRADSVGSNTLTDNNTVTGVLGQFDANASQFTSANSEWLSKTDNAGLSITGDMSFCVWSLPSTFPSPYFEQTLVSKSLSTGDQRGWHFGFAEDTGPFLGISANTLGMALSITPSGSTGLTRKGMNFPAVENSWNHICFSYTASAGTAEFYLNGVSQGTVSGLPTSIADNTADFQLGTVQSLQFYNGAMQDAVLWNVALTDSDVTSGYNAYFASTPAETPQVIWF